MPAYYYLDLYSDLGEKRLDEIIDGTMDALAEECPFLYITTTMPIDRSVDPMKRQYHTERVSVDLKTAKHLAIRDAEARISGRNDEYMPEITLHFDGVFHFDPELGTVKEAAKEITLSFWYQSLINSLLLHMNSWEECVLMYGKDETHRYNKKRILDIVKKVFIRSHAYYGWMDGELNSVDQSYDLITKGKSSIKNEFVILGKSLLEKVDLNNLTREWLLYQFFDDNRALVIERHFTFLKQPPLLS